MKKIGITTLYYNNNNYGGIAQAMALADFLNSNGFDAELVSYKRSACNEDLKSINERNASFNEKIKSKFDGFGKKLRRKVIEKPIEKCLKKKYQKQMEKRLVAFEKSRQDIPHSKVYTAETIKECENIYDVFITGSDQVWKPGVVQGAYVWDFLDKEKKCLSYAASITTEHYPEEYGQYMKKHLEKYEWISVREAGAKEYLQGLLNREIAHVVDPTLLVEDTKWNEIASERLIEEEYIFVYLLGDSYSQRNTIKKLARKLKKPIVTLPHVENKVRLCDWKFGDIQLYDIGVPEFFSLIKYASLVFTDSFHAVVFSNVFETNFWVFDRAVITKKEKMGSRIKTLLSMLGEENRKITDRCTMTQNEAELNIDFIEAKRRLKRNVVFSKEKLLNAINN